ncbi:MAG: LamG domain-containing protein, partial [Verrucomicrobiota bacterium]
MFDATVNDANGSATTTGIDITDRVADGVTTLAAASTFSTTIVSDGSDVTLEFELTTANPPVQQAFFVMNSFELSGEVLAAQPPECLAVDFTRTGGPVQADYLGYIATHEVTATFTAQSFPAFSTSVTVLPGWAAGAPNTARQMIDRGGGSDTPDLLRDWIGTDTRQVGNPITLTISDLPAGCYLWQSYHHDTLNQTGDFDVEVVDANGSTITSGIDITDAQADGVATLAAATSFNTTIVSDGSPITLTFTLTTANPPVTEAFFVMNSFKITEDQPDTQPDVVFTDSGIVGACPGVITRTWTAEDANGNVTAATQTISIVDNDAPSFDVTPPGDVTVECDAIPAPADCPATDNCDPDVSVVFTSVTNTSTLGSGVIHHWTGNNNPVDVVGGNTMNLVDDTTYGAGVVGNGFVFDGENDYAVTEDPVSFNGDYAIAFWFKSDGAGSRDVISIVQGPNHGILLEVTPTGTFRFLHRFPLGIGGGTSIFSGTAGLNDDEFHHVVAQKVGDQMSLYVDGALEASALNTSTITTPLDIIVGILREDNLIRDCLCTVDDLKVYNRGLSGAEVAEMYNGGSGTPCCSSSFSITRTWVAQDDCGNMTTAVQNIAVVDTSVPTLDCPDLADVLGVGGTPGLLFGLLPGNVNETDPNPATGISIDLSEANDTSIPGNTTEIFSGQIFDADGNISFRENI